MNLKTVSLVALVACSVFALGRSTALGQSETMTKIEATGSVELVKDGFEFTEGPAWDTESKTLLFSDIPASTIHRVDQEGTFSIFTNDSKHTNGILITSDGRVLGCQMDGQVVQYDRTTGEATVLASQYDGNRFNAPNDLVVDQAGGIYFTDPLFRAPTPLPQTVQAVYYIAKNGDVRRVTEGLAAPNGIGLSADGKQLYVCPSQQSAMLVYPVNGAGELGEPKTFCTLEQPAGKSDTGADGITLDVKGNVYITTHIGVQIFSPAGDQLGVVRFPQQPANVCFGGEDWKTMYVTARTGLYRVRMPIPGLH